MNKIFRKILLVTLPIIACALLVLIVHTAVIGHYGAESAIWTDGEDGERDKSTESIKPDDIPKDRAALAAFLKERATGITENDELTELFMQCDRDGYVRLDPDTTLPYILAEDGGKIWLSEISPDYQSRVTAKTYEKMIEIGETYVTNRKVLKYGNIYTPFNEKTTNQIDCSSFTSLVLLGIPFETSRFMEEENTARYDFGFSFPDNPYSLKYGPKRFLANEIGHYAMDQGFAFYPREDFSNLEPGDVLFFSTSETDGFYMDITHVAIFVKLTESGGLYVIHGNSSDVANYTAIYTKAEKTAGGGRNSFKNSLVLAARYPLLNQER